MHRRRPSATLRRLFNACEPLEGRRLLAASVSGTTLNIDGTSAADTITVALDGTDLVVTTNGAAQRFVKSSVTQINASLGNGDDSLKIDFAVNTPASLNGEAGNDTLVGGSGADTLDGGSGDDSLDGGEDASTMSSGDVDHLDTVTYATRTTAVTATLTLTQDSIVDGNGNGVGVDSDGHGSGGAAGEADTYQNVETILGGSGDDHFSLVAGAARAGVNTTNAVTLRAVGNAGNDRFDIASGFEPGHVQILADGGAGNDGFIFDNNRDPSIPLTLLGGDGNDFFSDSTDDGTYTAIDGGAGDDSLLIISHTQLTLTVPPGVENFEADEGSPTVTGNALDNVFTFGAGITAATVNGEGGNDSIDFSAQTAAVTGSLRVAYSYDGTSVTITGSASVGLQSIDLIDVETIVGGAGDDTLGLSLNALAPGLDPPLAVSLEVVGGAGNDDLSVASTDEIGVARASFVADGGAGDDSFNFGSNVGGEDAATLLGGDGNDSFGGGDDAAVTSIDGGAGIDELDQLGVVPDVSGVIPPNVENFTASVGGIHVVGNDLDNLITLYNGGNVEAGGGNDTIILKPSPGGSGSSLNGGDGNDTIVGNDQPNTLLGGDGDDSITGGTGNDVLDGGDGNNHLDGGDGNDTLSAGIGNDAIYGGAGDDSIHGDAGDDTLYGQDGRDKIWGGDGDDRVDGGNSNDVLRGEDGDDKVYGRDGNDSVSGGEGRDSLYGGDGNDSLNGDGGRDIVYGGAGTDAAPKQSIDRIYKEIERLA